jgi:hypothetical protein
MRRDRRSLGMLLVAILAALVLARLTFTRVEAQEKSRPGRESSRGGSNSRQNTAPTTTPGSDGSSSSAGGSAGNSAASAGGGPAGTLLTSPRFRLVMTSCAVDWNAFRLNRITGAVWIPNTEKDPAWYWQKLIDNKPLPIGDYELKASYYLGGEQRFQQVFRMDRTSGQTWHLDSGVWQPVGEPADFAQGPAPKIGYRLVIVSSPSSSETFRFNPETGATWSAGSDSSQAAWRRIAESEQLPVGDYDFQVVSVTSQGARGRNAARMERKTGRTWVASSDRWVLLAETADFANGPFPAAGFRLVTNASPKYWYVYRLNPETGETWCPQNVGMRSVLTRVDETDQIPRGDYDLQVVCWLADDGGYHYAVRIERTIGRMWLDPYDKQWNAVLERPDIATSTAPRSGFRRVTTDCDKSWYAVRFNSETGETWTPNQYGDEWILDRCREQAPIGGGNYDVRMASFSDNNGGSENIYRIERTSGTCWYFVENWLPLTLTAADGSPRKAGYQIFLYPAATVSDSFRFNEDDGSTWVPRSGTPTIWDKLVDPDPLPSAHYEFHAATYQGTNNAPYFTAIRINPSTGQSWYAGQQQWRAFAAGP